MKYTKFLFPAVILITFLFSMCDYVTSPYDVEQVVVTFDTTKRVALVEEWTGHTCIGCPAASTEIGRLEGIYGDLFCAISIHDDWFAEPIPPHPAEPCGAGHPGAFAEDFRCSTGVSYSSAHGGPPGSLPIGMVNRKYMSIGLDELMQWGEWEAVVDSVVNQSAFSSMHIDHTYNSSNRQVNATVWGTWITAPYTGTVNVALMLTESGMVGWQKYPTDCDSVYTFTHVLRECLNTPGSVAGTQIFTGTTTTGTTWSYTLPSAYVLPAGFNSANCHLIAMIYDTATGEVLQAWEEELE